MPQAKPAPPASPKAATGSAEPGRTAPELSDRVFIESLVPFRSVFRSAPKGDFLQFRLEPNGYVGSVTEVDRKLVFDPYVRRAIDRGKIKLLTEQEAYERIGQLVIPDEEPITDPVMESLSEGASERVNRYTRLDLPDDAEQGRAILPGEIWGGQQKPAAQKPQVQRQGASVSQGPILDSAQVLTEPIKQGDWESDLG